MNIHFYFLPKLQAVLQHLLNNNFCPKFMELLSLYVQNSHIQCDSYLSSLFFSTDTFFSNFYTYGNFLNYIHQHQVLKYSFFMSFMPLHLSLTHTENVTNNGVEYCVMAKWPQKRKHKFCC